MKLSCGFGAANRGHVGRPYFRKEAVTATRNSFYKARTLCGVAESLADFADRFVEPVVEIHESVCGPQLFLKLLADYDLAGVLKQHRQNLKRLFLKANSQAVLAQFAGAKVQLENPKAEPRAEVKVFLHKEVNAQRKGVYHPGRVRWN